MARLILFLLLFAVLALAVAAAATAWRALNAPVPRTAAKEDAMPPAIRNTAYVLLLVLLAGLTTGWLGTS